MRAAGAPHLVPTQPVSQVVKATNTQELYDLSLRVTWLRRLKLYERNVQATVEAREKSFGWQRRELGSRLPWGFICHEEISLITSLWEGSTVSNNPLAALVALSCDAEAASFRDYPLYPSRAAAPEAIVDRLRESGDIGTALALQEIILLDKRNKPYKEISAAELQKYCETYIQTWERLKTITSEVPVLPPLHNLLLLTRGKVRFPFNLSQVRLQDYLGRSLLHLALDLGVVEDELRYMELDMTATVPSDFWGRLPVHIACSRSSEAIAESFLDSNADLSVADAFGCTALHYAAASGNEKTVQMLLRRGAYIDYKDREGSSPLAWAAIRGHTVTVQVLALNGADINIENTSTYRTPLFEAVKEGHQATVKLLSDMGADINHGNTYYSTPLCVAIMGGHTETAIDEGHEDIAEILRAAASGQHQTRV
ncbi:ankyrin repeat-containing domain protein [Xylaria castorea]|nr:ankyrin repeat-containing domain protein [Xylaria castorea]